MILMWIFLVATLLAVAKLVVAKQRLNKYYKEKLKGPRGPQKNKKAKIK